METKVDRQALYGEWLHSSEEDTEDEIVYRPVDYAFPPTRAPRNSFQFEADGRVFSGEPSPSDKTEKRDGNWKLNKNVVTIISPERTVTRRIITSANKEKLVFKKR